jgi:hypothetical protein
MADRAIGGATKRTRLLGVLAIAATTITLGGALTARSAHAAGSADVT